VECWSSGIEAGDFIVRTRSLEPGTRNLIDEEPTTEDEDDAEREADCELGTRNSEP